MGARLPVVGSDASAPVRDLLEGPDPRDAPGVAIPKRVTDRARVVAEALFSSEEGPPSADRLDWLARELADFLGRSGPGARFLLRNCLFATVVLAPLVIGAAPPLSRLSIHDRRRALSRFEATLLGAAFLGCKAILCILWFEHPDVTKETGLRPAKPA